MESIERECPICKEPLAAHDGYYTCAQHGDWYSYSANLLVRAPSAESQAAERVLMPWEMQLVRAV